MKFFPKVNRVRKVCYSVHRYENRLIKTIQTIPHNLHVSVKLKSLYCGLRIILVYPNPQ